MHKSYKIDINLYQDWKSHISNELSSFGYDIDLTSDDEIVHTYLNLLKRLVSSKPRKILKSDEFGCPSELKQGLSNIENIISKGEDITPYLSRLLKKSEFNDPLLNHWGIHHIHLGERLESDGYIERTGPVLFCRFDNENAYFINVLPHGSWSMQNMITVLHNNWSNSIEQFRLKGVIGLAHTVTDEDVHNMRKAQINTMVEVEKGVVYAPIGGGSSTSGISVDVVREADYCYDRLTAMEQAVIENIEEIADDAKQQGIKFPAEPKFKLETKNNEIYAVEIKSMIPIRLGYL